MEPGAWCRDGAVQSALERKQAVGGGRNHLYGRFAGIPRPSCNLLVGCPSTPLDAGLVPGAGKGNQGEHESLLLAAGRRTGGRAYPAVDWLDPRLCARSSAEFENPGVGCNR